MKRKCGGDSGKCYDNGIGDNRIQYPSADEQMEEEEKQTKTKALFVGIMPFVLLYIISWKLHLHTLDFAIERAPARADGAAIQKRISVSDKKNRQMQIQFIIVCSHCT